MKLVIKVGTQAIVGEDSTVRESTMLTLIDQIAVLKREGHDIVLVSSGAVSSGRRVARGRLGPGYGKTSAEKQVLSSLGQHELMRVYTQLFKQHDIMTSQLLLTKQDFQTRIHYLNIARILKEILAQKNILAIVNENDSVAIEELIFTDNDELAGLIAAQLSADKLIILTSVDGVYNSHPDEPGAQLISTIDPANEDSLPEISATTSAHGRGGMISKLGVARKLSGLGITTHIANIAMHEVLINLVKGESLGTRVIARKKKSNIKRWMAFSEWQQTGSIHVNASLFEILKGGKSTISILPVGLEGCTGDFKKGDLIEIISPGSQQIGIGIARYDSDTLRQNLGKKNKPEIIHYDHLHIKIGN